MKKIIIVSPHFPPSNLAAVHRSRLFAQHLPSLGWEPIIVAVHEDYYEEELDWNLSKLLPVDLRIEKVKALKTKPIRLIGDIGIRGFCGMANRIIQLCRKEKIDFLYIPIPSFYAALLGRAVNLFVKIEYGIDYIDPWVHVFKGSERKFSRHWWSTKIAGWLEPIAVKNAKLITGVAQGYYQAVIDRNPHLKKQCLFASMPYGGEEKDHQSLKSLKLKPYLFEKKKDKTQLVYAGAMLPKAFDPLEMILKLISEQKEHFQHTELIFIGSGTSPNDPNGYNVKPLAQKYGLWETVIFEYPKRIPYLDVLIHLQAASGVFILGSTEPHYTPSKVYQAILSEKPILAVLHQASTAVEVIRRSKAGIVLDFDGENGLSSIYNEFEIHFDLYMRMLAAFDPKKVDQSEFAAYSAYQVSKQLAEQLDKISSNQPI